jgi:mannose-6-phosphate isomerase-like protein (cupin superfamily)
VLPMMVIDGVISLSTCPGEGPQDPRRRLPGFPIDVFGFLDGRRSRYPAVGRRGLGHQRNDAGNRNLPLQKRLVRDLVGGVDDRRHAPAGLERRARHAERPGFRITELQIGPRQQVPWHYHTSIRDTFYVMEGRLRLFLRDPKEEVRLEPGESYAVRAGRPHLVTNGGETSAVFLVLQGVGEYDFVPLT